MLDLALTSDQEQLVDTVRDFCAREFAPTIGASIASMEYPRATTRLLLEPTNDSAPSRQ